MAIKIVQSVPLEEKYIKALEKISKLEEITKTSFMRTAVVEKIEKYIIDKALKKGE